jgi:hypothetical protein
MVAQAGPADDQMQLNTQQYHADSARGRWFNPWMPQASVDTGTQEPANLHSGDAQMAVVLASYTRGVLDAGGWVNPFVSDQSYAVGNPLLAARVGEGVTSGSAVASLPVRALLARALN